MPPVIIAAGIGAAGAIGGSAISAHASSKATKAQVGAAADANALQKYQYDTTRADQAPWRDIGKSAIGQLQAFTTPGTDLTGWLHAQPGYNEGLNQGVDAISGSAATAGLLNSGGTLKALNRFGQDYANQNLTNIYNRLTNLAGMGQTANQATGAAGQNYANQAGNNLMDAGAARANGYANQSGMATNALGQVAGFGANMVGQYGGNPNQFAFGIGMNNTPMPTYNSDAGGMVQRVTPTNFGGGNFSTLPSF